MKERVEKVSAFIDSQREEGIKFLETLVNMESYSSEYENVRKVGRCLKEAYEKEGFECELVEVGQNAPALVGVLGKDRPGKPVVFCGHMDTVFPEGTLKENPFRIEDGLFHGPGVGDMKGGLTIGLLVSRALNDVGFADRPIKIVYVGDEEIGHCFGKGGQLITDEARGALCAFNLEPGLFETGEYIVGRRGSSRYVVKVHGVDAHAGRNYSEGRSAIKEMSHKIIDLEKLSRPEIFTTVNVGNIKGGTVANSVPAYCEVEIDVRFATLDEMNRVKPEIEKILNTTYVDGTSTEYVCMFDFPVFPTTGDVLRFADFIEKTCKKYGLKEGVNGYKPMGGASDVAFIAAAGVPTVCGSGIRAEFLHTLREVANVDSMFERAKMVATVILNLKDFE